MTPEIGPHMIDVEAALSQLTLEEKVALCSGGDFWHLESIPRLGIPSVMVTDGPHGLRKQRDDVEGFALTNNVPATCFPPAVTLASTWNRDLLRDVGTALGEEARAEGVSVVLGPGVNIKRSPLAGRNFEYYSEDPYLSSAMATAFIEGVQQMGVGTSIKHFAANNQETRRLTIDAVVDERALHEVYLASFERAVRAAQPWTVMAAYNRLNGTYCSEHAELLARILREAWGYEGLVVSDWGAVNDRVAGLKAGLDLEMPGLEIGRDARLIEAVRDGRLPMEVLDGAVERILTLIAKAGATRAPAADYDREAHHHLAQRAAGEGAVLLKNEEAILPLAPNQSLALIGAFAKHPRYQGGGSSGVTPTRVDTAYDAIAERIDAAGGLSYAAGYDPRTGTGDQAMIDEAQRIAQDAEVAVIIVGLPDIFETEGVDRAHMALPAHHGALVQAVARVNPNVVVVLMNGAPVEMPWHGEARAILEAYLGGQAGGSALAGLLYGEVNPSGKLAESFPFHLEDHPVHHVFPGGPRTVEYRESIYVGYRYYDTANQEVLFPFGHGLSYTSFSYTDLRLSAQQICDTDELVVTIAVTNTGTRAGQEVVQLYVRDVASTVFRPTQELKGFAKVALEPGASKDVTFTLNRRSFAYWDTEVHDWHVEEGAFEIRVGRSSRDIRATATVEVLSTAARRPQVERREEVAEYYGPSEQATFSEEAFAALYGSPLPSNRPPRPGEYTFNTPLADMRGTLGAYLLRTFIQRQTQAAFEHDAESPMARQAEIFLKEMPLRTLLLFSGGEISADMLEGMLQLANGQLIRGLGTLLRARVGG